MARRLVFMGTPEFAVPSLEALVHSSYQVVAVCTQPDRRAGRGRQVASSPVKQLALSRGIEVLQPDSLKATSAVERLTALAPELIVVAAFGQILPREVLALPEFGCVNVHPSLLPRHRGSSPISTAILQGDEVAGVTIMLMDTGVDSGPILGRREVSISGDDTTGSLGTGLAEAGAELLLETLALWLEGKIKPQTQEEARASYSKAVSKEDGELDWQLPAVELWRRVRAFDPWPGSYTSWRERRLKLSKVVPVGGGKCAKPGKVVALAPPASAAVGVETGDGLLGLLRVQLEGKREVSTEEFMRGQRDFVGSLLL